mmetsp:Transcript_62616/g.140868  ORF Transcript_62616/g.140868 Transcript_62616/m.140868 type:complete len:164 (-) Transcript_62616:140-631(-)
MSSLHAATTRMQGAGQSLPQEACHKRSLVMMEKLDKLEKRYVREWMDRIDLEAKSHDRMSSHLTTATQQSNFAAERYRTRNEQWAARAEMAARWRNQKEREKLERCSSNVELKDRKVRDFRSWQNRVFYEAPRQEVERRNQWLTGMQSSSNLHIEKHHRSMLG